MASLLFVTHPEVVVDPVTPVERWHLGTLGIERMQLFARSREAAGVASVWASTETKAIEAAAILAGALGLGTQVCADLGENDRRATGFLPPDEFERVADAFFARSEESVRGWERAVDAQARIVRAVSCIAAAHPVGGDLAVVAHGAVGTLLYCALAGRPIDRALDQTSQGHFWTAALPDLVPVHGWRPIAPPPNPDTMPK